jgi:hypothetical protein
MSDPCLSFEEVLKKELEEIWKSRAKREDMDGYGPSESAPATPSAGHPYVNATDMRLLGLAFSGGGIRSATFNLGILQGLARYGLLPRIDYLSTVSGGGYIGSWLTTWIKRACEKKETLEDISRDLASNYPKQTEAEAAPIRFLRRFSNYLTPRLGLFSGDTLAAAAIYTRNLLLNLVVLIPFSIALLLVPRLARHCMSLLWPPGSVLHSDYSLVVAVLCLAPPLLVLVLNLWRLRTTTSPPESYPPYAQPPVIGLFLVAPLLAAAWFFGPTLLTWINPCQVLPCSPLNEWTSTDKTVWAMPVTVALVSVAGIILVGVFGGGRFASLLGEWTSRAGGWFAAGGLFWLVFSAITLYSVEYWNSAKEWGTLAEWTDFWKTKAFWSGVITFLLGGGVSGVVGASESPKREMPPSKSPADWLTQLAPYALILGLFIALTLGTEAALDAAQLDSAGALSMAAVALVLFALAVSWRFGVNTFSLHYFYRNRLARCYLGASDPRRCPDPFMGFVPTGHTLRISDLVVSPPPDGTRPWQCPYYGPYHLVNTAVNLVAGKELAWQKRKAASFLLAPLYSGYTLPRATDCGKAAESSALNSGGAFRETANYEDGMSLGTAVAISGAAFSPNMGYHSSPPVAFLMTVLNVRLGWWLGNSLHDSWKKPSPRAGLFYLLFELFGATNSERNFVYLSDGGHFENLGIYELVRRRCRYIIACDAGADPELTFEDLGNAIEKCRSDFGIDIEIDVDAIRRSKETGYSETHCAFGKIRYDRVHGGGGHDSVGTLLYIKASLTGEEPADVEHYADEHPEFPHQTTVDQFFDESQFESYRALGKHIAEEVLNGAGEAADIKDMSTYQLFLDLKRYWYPPSVQVESHFTKHAAKVDEIYEELRTSKNLAFLSHQIYPEWRTLVRGNVECEKTVLWLPKDCDQLREGFYICNQVIQLMERVYLDLNLDQECDHPDNRGWMNFFRHWSWSAMFRVTWAISAATFGARFQTFCSRRLDLKIGDVSVAAARSGTPAVQPDWQDLEDKLVLNFVEVQLLKSVIKFDREKGLLKGDDSSFSVHPLVLQVSLPPRPESIQFHFGFALTYDITQESKTKTVLRCFRVQDHIRKMGLGRRGLTELMRHRTIAGINLKDYPTEEVFGKTQLPFPTKDELDEMRILFESVQRQRGGKMGAVTV